MSTDLVVSATGVGTEATAAGTLPLASLNGITGGAAPTPITHTSYVPAAEPLDTPAITTASVYSWNFGVAKQVVDVNGQNNSAASGGADKKMACLVLFSAPE